MNLIYSSLKEGHAVNTQNWYSKAIGILMDDSDDTKLTLDRKTRMLVLLAQQHPKILVEVYQSTSMRSQDQDKIDLLLKAGRRIEAIKTHREIYKSSLIEARDAVDDRLSVLGLRPLGEGG